MKTIESILLLTVFSSTFAVAGAIYGNITESGRPAVGVKVEITTSGTKPYSMGTLRFCRLGAVISAPYCSNNYVSNRSLSYVLSPINHSGTSAMRRSSQVASTNFTVASEAISARKARGRPWQCEVAPQSAMGKCAAGPTSSPVTLGTDSSRMRSHE